MNRNCAKAKWQGAAMAFILLAACSGGGGGGGGSTPAPTPNPPAPTPPGSVVVTSLNGLISANGVFAANCGAASSGTLYTNAEVEPQVAINPLNPANLIATWQQDRWSNGGSQGLVVAATTNGGATWLLQPVPVSRCGGGSAATGTLFDRATDPWVTFSPNGVAYQMSLALTGETLLPGSSSAMFALRSTDGGLTWGAPIALIRDGANAFNDKNAMTADPTDARFVYAVWDRLTDDNRGPLMFARTVDGGASWEAARAIYDPGVSAQTLGSVVGVLPDGTLVCLFTLLRTVGGQTRAEQTVMRSADKGATWSAPIKVADFLGIGTRDPETGQAIRDGGVLPQIAVGAQGRVHAVWQDARFSGGLRDAIALSTSTDGGLTWDAPRRVSADANAQALIGTVHARADGVVGVSYYDLRNNTADSSTLLADHWLATSSDLLNWADRRVTPASFNYASAPVARGLFLGDYMGLTSSGTTFHALHVRTTGDAVNRTDVFLTPVVATTASAEATRSVPMSTREDADALDSAAFRQRVHDNLVRSLEARVPGWARRHGLRIPE